MTRILSRLANRLGQLKAILLKKLTSTQQEILGKKIHQALDKLQIENYRIIHIGTAHEASMCVEFANGHSIFASRVYGENCWFNNLHATDSNDATVALSPTQGAAHPENYRLIADQDRQRFTDTFAYISQLPTQVFAGPGM